MKHWYVYMATYQDSVVYIGKGKDGRHLHINSGVSNCYEANKVHFEGGIIHCEPYASFWSENNALNFEKEMILEFQPTWNIVFMGRQNARGKNTPNKRFVKKGSSKFMGVCYRDKPSGGKNTGTVAKHWRATVHYKGKCHHVGNYVREVDAAIARDLYILNNGIEGLLLNFPDKNYSEILDEYLVWD